MEAVGEPTGNGSGGGRWSLVVVDTGFRDSTVSSSTAATTVPTTAAATSTDVAGTGTVAVLETNVTLFFLDACAVESVLVDGDVVPRRRWW